jgi:hypothetical protein
MPNPRRGFGLACWYCREPVARSDLHSFALSFAQWRNKVPPDATCISAPDTARFIAVPSGLHRWMRRTARGDCRIAFARGDEWWAYDLIDVTTRRGTPDPHVTRRFFVIASSDRHDPEWGADHEYDVASQRWRLSDDISDVTRRRLTSVQIKA